MVSIHYHTKNIILLRVTVVSCIGGSILYGDAEVAFGIDEKVTRNDLDSMPQRCNIYSSRLICVPLRGIVSSHSLPSLVRSARCATAQTSSECPCLEWIRVQMEDEPLPVDALLLVMRWDDKEFNWFFNFMNFWMTEKIFFASHARKKITMLNSSLGHFRDTFGLCNQAKRHVVRQSQYFTMSNFSFYARHATV